MKIEKPDQPQNSENKENTDNSVTEGALENSVLNTSEFTGFNTSTVIPGLDLINDEGDGVVGSEKETVSAVNGGSPRVGPNVNGEDSGPVKTPVVNGETDTTVKLGENVQNLLTDTNNSGDSVKSTDVSKSDVQKSATDTPSQSVADDLDPRNFSPRVLIGPELDKSASSETEMEVGESSITEEGETEGGADAEDLDDRLASLTKASGRCTSLKELEHRKLG